MCGDGATALGHSGTAMSQLSNKLPHAAFHPDVWWRASGGLFDLHSLYHHAFGRHLRQREPAVHRHTSVAD